MLLFSFVFPPLHVLPNWTVTTLLHLRSTNTQVKKKNHPWCHSLCYQKQSCCIVHESASFCFSLATCLHIGTDLGRSKMSLVAQLLLPLMYLPKNLPKKSFPNTALICTVSFLLWISSRRHTDAGHWASLEQKQLISWSSFHKKNYHAFIYNRKIDTLG